MRATGWLIRHRLRRGRVALLALAVVVALGAGSALVALGAAVRTDRAYAGYLERAEVGDLAINPSLATAEIEEVIRGLPGVTAVTHDAMLWSTVFDDGHPRARELLDDEHAVPILVRGSSDGRGQDMDRPAIERGRPISARHEALVTREVADDHDVELGDRISIALWGTRDDFLAAPEDIVHPVGVEELTVVGIATLPDEVLADDLFSRGQVLVSPEVATTYDCLPGLPPVDATLDEAVLALFPEGCATSYAYFSLALEDGAAGVDAAAAAFTEAADALNETAVPASVRDLGAGYFLIGTTTADEQERVERSVQPTTTALAVLGLGAAAVTLVVAALAIARGFRRADAEVALWRQSGLTLWERARILLVPPLVAVLGGFGLALLAAWLLSPIGPVGAVRAVDPSPGRELHGLVVAAAGALIVAAVAGLVLLARHAARRADRTSALAARHRRPPRLLRAGGPPEVAEGLRAALAGGRGGGLVAASGGIAVGVLLAAVVFGATLGTVLSTPSSYGWRWDLGVLGGFGYGRQDVDEIERTLGARSAVRGWEGIALGSTAVDGEQVTGIVGFADSGPFELTMARGRMPTGGDEVALGSRTAAAIGAGIGDEVEVSGELVEPTTATVTGIAVLPPLGRYQSDRASPGVGVVLAPDLVGEDLAREMVTFIGLDLEPDTDVGALAKDLQPDISSWAIEGDYPYTYPSAVRPPEIVDADSMRRIPLVVGGMLAAAAVIALVSAVVVSVRARRRELGLLRALGFTGRQLRTSVRVQALTTMAVAMAVGVPLGIVGGRLAWRAFATRLGVVTDPATPWAWIGGAVVVGLLVALVAAAGPGRAAARLEVREALRAE